MVGNTVTHRFDEDGAAAVFEGHTSSSGCRLADGEDVVAVDADCVDAVTDSATGDAVAAVLVQGRGGDRVAVIPADEDYGAGSGCGDVEGGVEVSFACGTFAEIAGYYSRFDVWVLEGLHL